MTTSPPTHRTEDARMKRTEENLTLSSEYVEADREEIMSVLRDAMDTFGTIDRLSIRTGISPACLYKIANGTTRWPRHNTLFILMHVLRLRLTLIRLNS